MITMSLKFPNFLYNHLSIDYSSQRVIITHSSEKRMFYSNWGLALGRALNFLVILMFGSIDATY